MISILYQLQKTFDPQILELVSIYIKLSPIGGITVAPLFPVGELVFVHRMKFCILPLLFLSLQNFRQLGKGYAQLFEFFIIVVSVNSILFYI